MRKLAFCNVLQNATGDYMSQSQNATPQDIAALIEAAAEAAGSQVKLAKLLDTTAPTLIQMKQGKRPANWRIRGKLRAVLGEDPAQAFMAAMAEDLEKSENEDEKKAADGLKTMLAAFPNDWRRLFLPPQKTLRTVVRFYLFVHKTFDNRFRNTETLTYTLKRV